MKNDMKNRLITNDLWELDKLLLSMSETNTVIFAENLLYVPVWIDKHWKKNMLYKGFDIMDFLYKKWEPKFHDFLIKTMKCKDVRECFVSYKCGTFFMGYDVWYHKPGKEERSGWACFAFSDKSYINDNVKVYDISALNSNCSRENCYIRENELKLTMDLDDGTFYNYKYESLYDYFTYGGYALKIDTGVSFGT